MRAPFVNLWMARDLHCLSWESSFIDYELGIGGAGDFRKPTSQHQPMRAFVGFIDASEEALQATTVQRVIGERFDRLFREAPAPGTWMQRDLKLNATADRRMDCTGHCDIFEPAVADIAI